VAASVLVDGKNIFVGHPGETNTVKDLLEVWTLSDTGKFVTVANPPLALPSAAQNLAAFGDLLAVQISNDIQLYNKAAPATMYFWAKAGRKAALIHSEQCRRRSRSRFVAATWRLRRGAGKRAIRH